MSVDGLEWNNARALHEFVQNGTLPAHNYQGGLKGNYYLTRSFAGSWNHRVGSLTMDIIVKRSEKSVKRLMIHTRDMNDGTTSHGGGEPFSTGYDEHATGHIALGAIIAKDYEIPGWESLWREAATFLGREFRIKEMFTRGQHPQTNSKYTCIPGFRALSARNSLLQHDTSNVQSILRGDIFYIPVPANSENSPSGGQYISWALQERRTAVLSLMDSFDEAPSTTFNTLSFRVPFHIMEYEDGSIAGWWERNANGNNPPTWAVVWYAGVKTPTVINMLAGKKGGIRAGSVSVVGNQLVGVVGGARPQYVNLPESKLVSHIVIGTRPGQQQLPPPVQPPPISSNSEILDIAGAVNEKASDLRKVADDLNMYAARLGEIANE